MIYEGIGTDTKDKPAKKRILRYRTLALEEWENGRFAVTEDGAVLCVLNSHPEGIASFCATLELRLNRQKSGGMA